MTAHRGNLAGRPVPSGLEGSSVKNIVTENPNGRQAGIAARVVFAAAIVGLATFLLVVGGAESSPEEAVSSEQPPPPDDFSLHDSRVPAPEALPEIPAIWTPLPVGPLTSGPPHQAVVWTGEEMLVWGSQPNPLGGTLSLGAAFDVDTESWRSVAATPGPAREDFAHVWTGTELLVWGGTVDGTAVADGLRYHLDADRWSRIAAAPISPRWGATAVWAGGEMFVFGGYDGSSLNGGALLHDAAAYDPVFDRWRRIADLPGANVRSPDRKLPAVKVEIIAVWTGDSIVAIGGALSDDVAVYHPGDGTWIVHPSPLGIRFGHTVTWTGTEVVVIGGSVRDGTGPEAAAWSPATAEWRVLSDMLGTERTNHGAAWAGDGILVWGGSPVRAASGDDARLAKGLWYDVAGDTWLPVSGRSLLWGRTTVLWIGDVGLVWGAGLAGTVTLPEDREDIVSPPSQEP